MGGGGGGVITKSDYFIFWGEGSYLYILGLFKVKIQNGNIFTAAKFLNIFGYA